MSELVEIQVVEELPVGEILRKEITVGNIATVRHAECGTVITGKVTKLVVTEDGITAVSIAEAGSLNLVALYSYNKTDYWVIESVIA